MDRALHQDAEQYHTLRIREALLHNTEQCNLALAHEHTVGLYFFCKSLGVGVNMYFGMIKEIAVYLGHKCSLTYSSLFSRLLFLYVKRVMKHLVTVDLCRWEGRLSLIPRYKQRGNRHGSVDIHMTITDPQPHIIREAVPAGTRQMTGHKYTQNRWRAPV